MFGWFVLANLPSAILTSWQNSPVSLFRCSVATAVLPSSPGKDLPAENDSVASAATEGGLSCTGRFVKWGLGGITDVLHHHKAACDPLFDP